MPTPPFTTSRPTPSLRVSTPASRLRDAASQAGLPGLVPGRSGHFRLLPSRVPGGTQQTVTRWHAPFAVLILAALVACSKTETVTVSGPGGSVSVSTSPVLPPSPALTAEDEAQIEKVVRQYLEASRLPDYALRARLSTGALRDLQSNLARALPWGGNSASELDVGSVTIHPESSDVVSVEVKATLTRYDSDDQKAVTKYSAFTLRREDKGWRVSDYVRNGATLDDSYFPVHKTVENNGIQVQFLGVGLWGNSNDILAKIVNKNPDTYSFANSFLIAGNGQQHPLYAGEDGYVDVASHATLFTTLWTDDGVLLSPPQLRLVFSFYNSDNFSSYNEPYFDVTLTLK